jgi:Ca2+-binding RTX toxin-like protein
MKGTRDKDFINGKPGDDTLYGRKGPDFLSGGEGSDKLYSGPGGYNAGWRHGGIHWDDALGGPGSDSLYGSGGRDHLSGGTGSDKVYGGTDGDSLSGGPAFRSAPLIYSPPPPELDSSDDYIYGGPGGDGLDPGWVSGGVDHLYGEDGDYRFYVNQLYRSGDPTVTKEIVDCGSGDDSVYYDEGVNDVNNNCEYLHTNYGNDQGH